MPAYLTTLATLPLVACALSAWTAGCAGPIRELWPPAPGAETYRIVVSTDSWHSIIGIWPRADPRGDSMEGLEEWGYAEKGYYMEADTGSSGTMRALLVPSTGVLQLWRGGPLWSIRTPHPPAGQWVFELSERGHERLLQFVEGSKRSAVPLSSQWAESTWFEADRSYHAFHHCHHWTARALREAGLPIWPFYALFKWSLEAQLDRAVAMAVKTDVATD